MVAGHSKWAQIKRKKAVTDQKRGKIFSKIAREITVAARLGGGNPDMNPTLRLSLQKAKDENMPKDNIERAIEKGVGGGEGANMEEAIYEAYAPGGVAVLIETLTDNKNRTVSNVRSILTKAGGSMAGQGSVSYMFYKKGLILFEPGSPEERVMEIATENGAEDIGVQEDGSIEVVTEPGQFEKVRKAFEEQEISFLDASISMVAENNVELDEKAMEKIEKLIEDLEEDDDVQGVWGNYVGE